MELLHLAGGIKNILKKTRHLQPPVPTTKSPIDSTDNDPSVSFMKTPAAKLPQLNANMTNPQFRKFKTQTNWLVFKRITNIPDNQIHAQLYSCCGDHVQNCFVNTIIAFFTITDDQLLTTLEQFTKKSNPPVHHLHFESLIQPNGESIKDYVLHLIKSIVPNCKNNLSNTHAEDQFIHDLQNYYLQTDIFAKASLLSLFEDVLKHASI